MKAKMLEVYHQEEKLKMQQKHDSDVQKVPAASSTDLHPTPSVTSAAALLPPVASTLLFLCLQGSPQVILSGYNQHYLGTISTSSDLWV